MINSLLSPVVKTRIDIRGSRDGRREGGFNWRGVLVEFGVIGGACVHAQWNEGGTVDSRVGIFSYCATGVNIL